MYFFYFVKHDALSTKSKDWLYQNLDNLSEWSDYSTYGRLFYLWTCCFSEFKISTSWSIMK